MKKTTAALFAAILAAAAPASAVEWNTMGPRSMGMGGAGVALAQGPLASYWNPAALGRATENAYGLAVPASVHAALTGTAIAGANDLKNAQNVCKANPLDPACQTQVNAALAELSNPTNGLRVDGSAGGDFKVGKIAFFVNGFLDAGAVPRIDNVNTSAAAIAAGSNTSTLIVKGAQITEFGAGYGHELPFAPGVFLGGDLKIMRAKVGYVNYRIIQANTQSNNNSSNIVSQLKNDAASSGGFGVDAGALWDVERTFGNAWWQPRVGLTGRNLNNPKFTQPAAAAADGVGGKYAVNPQARLGLAISPFHWWNIAADMDLTRNLTPVDGVASRQLGLGTEVNVFNRSWINIPLRFGLARNVATGTNMVTAGAGLNFLHLIIDASGEVSPKTTATQSQGKSVKIPTELGAAVQVSLLFGGSEDRPSRAKPAPEVQPAPAQQAEPAKASNEPTPAQVDQVKKNAAEAQKELDQAKPAPAGQ